jgi:hypothetical protein
MSTRFNRFQYLVTKFVGRFLRGTIEPQSLRRVWHRLVLYQIPMIITRRRI